MSKHVLRTVTKAQTKSHQTTAKVLNDTTNSRYERWDPT